MTSSWLRALVAVGVALAAASSIQVGCGSNVDTQNAAAASVTGTSTGAGAGGTGTGTATGSPASTGAGGAPATGCPASIPDDGAPCSDDGLVCEFEDGPFVDCRASALCTGGQWLTELPGCTSFPPPADCPVSPPSPGPCLDDGAICLYDDGAQCGCTTCLGPGPCGTDAEWVCAPPPADGCSKLPPLLGHACSPDGLSCTYGSCSFGTQAERTCKGGVWIDVPVDCPL